MSERHINAAVLHNLGEAPRYERFSAPASGEGTVVVTVTAAALKPADRWLAGCGPVPGQYARLNGVPRIVGADGVGRLDDGTRVAFFGPQWPYGGMADQVLVRRGLWFALPDGVDDVMTAALLNPGMAAWKALVWEGGLAAGETVLVLGATGASGRIATRLARRYGAGRVVAAGRDRRALELLAASGADATVCLDGTREEVAGALADQGPYDLIIDYLWGAPTEALVAALTRTAAQRSAGQEIIHVLVGMSAGEAALIPAIGLRSTPLRLIGSGTGPQPGLEDAARAFQDLLRHAENSSIPLEFEPVPLAEVEEAWRRPVSRRRIVFVP
jgi:NADPH2:quinone reductase